MQHVVTVLQVATKLDVEAILMVVLLDTGHNVVVELQSLVVAMNHIVGVGANIVVRIIHQVVHFVHIQVKLHIVFQVVQRVELMMNVYIVAIQLIIHVRQHILTHQVRLQHVQALKRVQVVVK